MKVAIIEDSSVLISFFNHFLSSTEYNFRVYSSAPQDIACLEKDGADVVICPGLPKHQDGLLLVSLIKANPEFQNTDIIVSTSMESLSLQTYWDLNSIDGILVKPFTEQRLKNLLDQFRAKQLALKRRAPLAVIVDDSSAARAILKNEMQNLGFQVKIAVNGRKGVDLVLQTMPDLVLTDMEMPEKNGLELCADLSSNPRTDQIPIIIISCLVNDEKVRQWFKYGASHFLQKPVDFKELAWVVNNLGGRKKVVRHGSALVVENNPTSAAIIRHGLEAVGVQSNLCRTLSELEAYLAVCRPDLITLDLDFPDGDAAMACRKIRARPDLESSTIIIISEGKQQEAVVSCLGLGANDFLTKPFTREEFKARVQIHLRTKRLFDELSQRNRMLEALAYKDSLTGLMNRRYLDEVLEQELDKARGSGDTLGFIIIDLDHFKKVNNTYGHNIGDMILKEIALVIQNCVGTAGIPCRYGGEEMCVFLPGLSMAKTKEIAERIRSASAGANFTDQAIRQTLSIGVSIYPHLSDGASLIQDADQALYQAKMSGRNRVIIFSQ